MRKTSTALLATAMLMSSLVLVIGTIPKAEAATLPDQTKRELLGVLATAQIQLRAVANQLLADQLFFNNLRSTLATLRANLEVIARIEPTDQTRPALEAALNSTQTTLTSVNQKIDEIDKRRTEQVSILAQLTAKFRALVTLIVELNRQ